MKRVVSVVMSSFRDLARTQATVDALHDMHGSLDVDVVVASPGFEVAGATNVHDREIGGGELDRVGANRSMVGALGRTRGDYVAWLSDSTMPTPGCLEAMVD